MTSFHPCPCKARAGHEDGAKGRTWEWRYPHDGWCVQRRCEKAAGSQAAPARRWIKAMSLANVWLHRDPSLNGFEAMRPTVDVTVMRKPESSTESLCINEELELKALEVWISKEEAMVP